MEIPIYWGYLQKDSAIAGGNENRRFWYRSNRLGKAHKIRSFFGEIHFQQKVILEKA